ncbi:MAG: adenylate/guanylate cyclase domain-containing protein [Spirochaetaceae bacterium]|nr:adenylate/guanylate cyclase domain-containing protein [Spirochaetaceae bacterium]
MKVSIKRFSEEFIYYSSQLFVFFMVTILMTSGSLSMGITSSAFVLFFMLIQTVLLAGYGHIPVLRFIFSFITPLGYTILRAATSSMNFFETTNVLLWCAAAYLALFQTISLSVKRPFIKQTAEAFLSIGSAVIFFFFYYYLDKRINLTSALAKGQLSATEYEEAIKITHFFSGIKNFTSSSQHLFALMGILSFDFMLLAARIRTIGLRNRIDHLIEERSAEPEAADVFRQYLPVKRDAPFRQLVSVISSDIVGFTELSEQLGPRKAAAFLNKYYALWAHAAGIQGGRIISITGDSLIVMFGLADESLNADRALAAAYIFLDNLGGLQEDLSADGFQSELSISLGVHSGMVVSAQLGPPDEYKHAVFGDTLAVAARLDSLCRELHQGILVSHSTFRRLSLESQATLDRVGEILLRQSTRPMPVYSRKQ